MAPDAKKRAAPEWREVHLLIVSQDDQLRFWARTAFRKVHAADVLSTPTGSEALHILKQASADIILLDLFKEPRRAVRFVQHLRAIEQFAAVPLVLLVQSGDEAWVRAACEQGIQNVIRKPVAEGELVKRVAATIADPRPLVWTDNYIGKERRTPDANFKGPDRRAAKPPPSAAEVAPPAARPAAQAAPPPPARPVPQPVEIEDAAAIEAAEEARRARRQELENELAAPVAAKPAPPAPQAIETRDAPAPAANRDAEWEEALGPAAPARSVPAAPEIDIPRTLSEHALWLETRGKEGVRAQLQGKDLSGADLANADLSNANMRGADLSGADCSGANFEGVDMRQAVLTGARSRGVRLNHAKLRHADLRGCDLRGANLRDSDLAGANLGGALLAAADLAGANLLHTDLAGADLGEATGLRQAQLLKALGDAKTQLPGGLRLMLDD